MVRYPINEIQEGMVLGESIYQNERLLIAAGFRLNRQHIEQLKSKGYSSLLIHVPGTEEVIPESIINQQVENELRVTVNKSSKNIQEIIDRGTKEKHHIQDIIKRDKKYLNHIIQNSGAVEIISKMIEDITSEPWTIVNITKMQEASDSLFRHSVNVTIVSLCIGHKYHLPQEELKQLGLGAINFDIGLIAVPKEILNKETPLNDSEKKLLHQHTVWGYMMLSENSVIPATSSIIALSHHEHQNGTGYPRAQKGENRPPLKANAKSGLIHRFAEIVAVADVYDMLTNGRKHFAAKLEPRKAFQKIIEMRGTVLNSEIVKTFMSTVPVYPVGTRVKIVKAPFANLDGCYAVISKIDPDNIMEPQILVIETKLKNKMTKPITIDLSKNKGFELELAS